MPRRAPKDFREPVRTRENLMMKWRVVPLVRMTKSMLMEKLDRAVRTGVVPEGIEIRELNWEKGHAKRYRAGQIDGDDWVSLRKFHRALRASTLRAERVR